MRILYVFREYRGDRRKRYGEIMSSFGHEVIYSEVVNKQKSNQIEPKNIEEIKPDLVWLLQPSFLANKVVNKDVVEYLKEKHIPIVTYFTFSTDVNYEDWLKYWRLFDFAFVHNIHLYQWLKSQGLNAHYMPIGFYPDMYRRAIRKSSMNISFMGACQTTVKPKHDKRVRYLEALAPCGIQVFGGSFKDRLKKGLYVGPYKSHEKQIRVYSRSKINLDLPFVNSDLPCYAKIYHIKNRFFEIPASGNFLMTIRCPEFLNIFDESMVGYYDDNVKSIRATAEKYLKDKSLRREMAERAHKVVHQKHTFRHRFADMFNIIQGQR